MTGVFCQRKDMAKNMAGKANRVDSPRGSRWPGERMSGGAAWEDLPEALPVERYAGHQAMLEQGLRLNRAFIAIKDPRVREAIVNLVVETAKNASGEGLRLATQRHPRTGSRR